MMLSVFGVIFALRFIPPKPPPSFRTASGPIPANLTVDRKIAVWLVAWIVENKKMPGFDMEYPEREFIDGKSRFVVDCDFIDDSIPISTDSRVYRIDYNDIRTYFDGRGKENDDLILIRKIETKGNVIQVHLENWFGGLGGHGFTFYFHVTDDGIRVEGELFFTG